MKRKLRDRFLMSGVCLSAGLTIAVLALIIGFIFLQGVGKLDLNFLFGDYNERVSYLQLESGGRSYQQPNLSEGAQFVEKFGIGIAQEADDKGTPLYKVVYVDKSSPVRQAANPAGAVIGLEKGDIITKVGSATVSRLQLSEVVTLLNGADSLRIKVTHPGGGIWPMVVTTLLTIGLTLLIAIPIGVLAAIYQVEYARQGRLLRIIRFATESLSGIPSIVFGLFGMLFFVKFMRIGQSVLSGSLTLAIILLPTIIRTTEEALKTIPASYKEASYGLGANRLQTLRKVVLPGSIPGILVAVILSIGRIVGESAALLFTMGTFAQLPSSIFDTASTLTVRAYVEVKEYGNVEMACGIGVVLLVIVFILNISARLISNRLVRNR